MPCFKTWLRILRGSDIGASEACKVAKELGVTVEELVTGKTIKKNTSESMLSDACRVYEDKEELHLVDKLIEILRSKNEKSKKIITNNINILCGDKMWIKEGKKERRKKLVPYHGKLERRIKIHVYS